MNYRDYIISDYRIMLGKPVIKGTRLTVAAILRKMSEGADVDQLTQMYPDLTKDAIMAALQYAAELISNEDNLESAA